MIINVISNINSNNPYLKQNKKEITFKATAEDVLKIADQSFNMNRKQGNSLRYIAEYCKEFGESLDKPFEIKLGQQNDIPAQIADKKAKGITLAEFERKLNHDLVGYQKRNTTQIHYMPQSYGLKKLLELYKADKPDVLVIGDVK